MTSFFLYAVHAVHKGAVRNLCIEILESSKRYEKQDFAKRPRSYWEFVHGFTPSVRKPSRCGVTCGCITIPSTKSWYSWKAEITGQIAGAFNGWPPGRRLSPSEKPARASI